MLGFYTPLQNAFGFFMAIKWSIQTGYMLIKNEHAFLFRLKNPDKLISKSWKGAVKSTFQYIQCVAAWEQAKCDAQNIPCTIQRPTKIVNKLYFLTLLPSVLFTYYSLIWISFINNLFLSFSAWFFQDFIYTVYIYLYNTLISIWTDDYV